MPQSNDFLAGAKPLQGGAGGYVDPLAGATFVGGPPSARTAPIGTLGPDTRSPGVRWAENVENDLRGGGARTLIGKGLGWLQGRGNRGYTGLESGTTPETANIIGSPELGAARMVRGAEETTAGHPLTGMGHMAQGALQAVTVPSMMVPEESIVAKTPIRSMFGIPTAEHAAETLNEVGNAARNVPLTFEKTRPALEEYSRYEQAGGANPKVMRRLVKRVGETGETGFEKPLVKTPAIRGLLEAPERDVPLDKGVNRGSTRGGLFNAEVNPEYPYAPRSGNPAAPISDYPAANPHYLSGSEHPELAGRFAPPKGVLRTREPIGSRVPTDEFDRMNFPEPPEPATAAPPSGRPMNFPEGRRFYTNVSRASAKPGWIRRAMESPAAPDVRRNVGAVKTALNADLTRAAEKVGKGSQYTKGMNEYRHAKQIEDVARKVGAAAAGGALIKYGGPIGRTAFHISRVAGR